jgi:hypothetical protein
MAEPGEALTEDNIDEHVAQVPGIFGDTPTDATTARDSVVSKNQEEATQNVAEVAADAEDGDEDAEEATEAEAARQTDAAAPTGAYAEEVDEAAPEEDGDEDGAEEGDDDAADENGSDDATAAEVIEEIEAADSAEAVDELAAGDERVTVQRAADKRKEELSE